MSLSESSSDSDSSSSIDMFNLDSPLARKRRRTSGQRNICENKKVYRSQRQHMIRSFVDFKDEEAFTDYKIIVDGHDPIHVHKLVRDLLKAKAIQHSFINLCILDYGSGLDLLQTSS